MNTMNDLKKIKEMRKEVMKYSNAMSVPDENQILLNGFCVVKKGENVEYIPYTDPKFEDTFKKYNNESVLCASCANCYAHLCPKVHAPSERLGKCIEDFPFITEGAQFSPGVINNNCAKHFFIVTACTHYEKEKKGAPVVPFGEE